MQECTGCDRGGELLSVPGNVCLLSRKTTMDEGLRPGEHMMNSISCGSHCTAFSWLDD